MLFHEVIDMMWTQKEASLLEDLKKQEQLCVDKYTEYMNRANAPELKSLFQTIRDTEQQHLQTISGMINGQLPQLQQSNNNQNASWQPPQQQAVPQTAAVQADAYLCQDALDTEKHVSSSYDTAVFEFRAPAARQVLSDIQGAEQYHGEMIYAYMARNGMYQANS